MEAQNETLPALRADRYADTIGVSDCVCDGENTPTFWF